MPIENVEQRIYQLISTKRPSPHLAGIAQAIDDRGKRDAGESASNRGQDECINRTSKVKRF